MRTRISEIRETGRNTMGVKLIDLARNEKLQDIAKVVSQSDDEGEPAAAADPLPDADEPPPTPPDAADADSNDNEL